MRRVARRLDRNRAAGETRRQRALGFERVERGGDMRGKAGVEGQGRMSTGRKARL
jgi:hypothetical protein